MLRATWDKLQKYACHENWYLFSKVQGFNSDWSICSLNAVWYYCPLLLNSLSHGKGMVGYKALNLFIEINYSTKHMAPSNSRIPLNLSRKVPLLQNFTFTRDWTQFYSFCAIRFNTILLSIKGPRISRLLGFLNKTLPYILIIMHRKNTLTVN
jgi:hypothetical protein